MPPFFQLAADSGQQAAFQLGTKDYALGSFAFQISDCGMRI
jgi:hypothetical protein